MLWHVLSKDSGGLFSLGEVIVRPGDEPPLHIHSREDETWYVLEGRILFQRGMERVLCEAGESISLPRGIAHGFAVQSEHARILHFYAPAGIETAFRELSVLEDAAPVALKPETLAAKFAAHGVTFVGPPLPVLLADEQQIA